MNYTKAFINHKYNGVRLQFNNGNGISTVWGVGTYSDNHGYDSGDIVKDFSSLNKDGSNTAEIMIFTEDVRLSRRIYRKCRTDPDNGVIGWLDINTWLWVINQLAKAEGGK